MKNYSEVYRAQHIDLVTRRNHVKGVRRKDDFIASTDWQSFLRITDNKSGFFRYLSNQLVKEKVLHFVCAFNDMCRKTCSTNDMSVLYPTNHEKTNSKGLLGLYNHN